MRAAEEFDQMSKGELMRRTAESYSDDKEEQRLAMYALAVCINPAPTPERIERARRELESLGIGGFDSESLLAMYNDPIYAEFEEAFDASGELASNDFYTERDLERAEALLERIRKLAIAAGSIAAQTEAPPFKSRRSETKPSVRPGRPRRARHTATTRASGR